MEAEERSPKRRRLGSEPSIKNGPLLESSHQDVCEDQGPTSNLGPKPHENTEPSPQPNPELITTGNPDAGTIDKSTLSDNTGELISAPQLSKNQLKKLRHQQEWEAGRTARKAKRKIKIQEKKERKREAREHGVSSKSISSIDNLKAVKAIEATSKPVHRKSVQLPIAFILDCGFDDLMFDKERVSLASQLTRCYSDNHHAPFKAHLAISSFGGHLKERFETVLSKHHENWKNVRFLDGDFTDAVAQAKDWMVGAQGGILAGAFAPSQTTPDPSTSGNLEDDSEVVYLTSDSPSTLTALKPYSTYIIGGLVDRNRHKGICYQRALDRGFKTAKLPIGEYMEMTSRFVLATNHVAEIMLRWLECGDWGEAFLRVVPKRKGGVLKEGKMQEEGRDKKGDEGDEDERSPEEIEAVPDG